MNLKLVTGPTTYAVSPSKLAEHLRLSYEPYSEEYIALTDLIAEASRYIDGAYGYGVCLTPQTWEMGMDGFCDEIAIPLYPLKEVASVNYLDTDGVEQMLDSSVYQVNDYGMRPTITRAYNQTWPSYRLTKNTVKIRFVCGFDSVPQDLQHAVLLLAGHWYVNREPTTQQGSTTALPFSFEAIMNKYKLSSIS